MSSPYPYCPFVPFRIAPKQKFNVRPEHELGLRGFLCETYITETKQGEWRLFEGMWAFVLNQRISFGGVLPKPVLEYFGLTPETLKLLEESACALHPLFQMYHFLPKKDWKNNLAWHKQYLAECERLHQVTQTVSSAGAFGSMPKFQKSNTHSVENLPEDVVRLVRAYRTTKESFDSAGVFDADFDEYKAMFNLAEKDLRVRLAQGDVNYGVNLDTFVDTALHWYGNQEK